MRKLTSLLFGIAVAMASIVPAMAFTPAPRAFNVTFDGFYILTSNSVETQQTLRGIGVIEADSAGALTGIEDLTLANPSPASPGSTLACNGTLGSSSGIKSNNDGTYNMTIDFVPDAASAMGCFQSTTSYVCTRHVVRQRLENDLSAGQYHCVATNETSSSSSVTIGAVSEIAFFGAHIIDTVSGD